MNKSLKAVCLGLTFFNSSFLFSQTINGIVPQIARKSLEEDGIYKLIHNTGDNDYVLLPECEFKENCETVRVEKQKNRFPFIAEILYKIDKENLKELNQSQKDEFTISDVSKIMRSVSKMKGMQYYSTTRKKRLTLYKDAYTLESEENPVAINDILDGSADGKVIYGFLNDVSFGPCKYKLSYHENESALYARFTNLDAMGLGLIQAIQPYDMIINLIVIDCGDYFLLYLGTDTDCKKFPWVAGQLEDSLVSRLVAIYDWFLHQF